MRCARSLPLLLSAIALITACGRDKPTSAKDVLAKDTALAGALRKAEDTTAYGEAADVATADLPDSGLVPMRVSKAPTSGVPPASVPRDQTPDPAPAPPTAAPATRDAVGGEVTTSSTTTSHEPIPSRATSTRTATRPGSAVSSDPTPACESPALTDQRRCLMAYLARSDAGLDRTYQAVIAELKLKAGTASSDREPDTVQRLRVAQRAWLVYRDTECRRRNRAKEGPLWAPTRARCLGEFSGQRADELAESLARLQAR